MPVFEAEPTAASPSPYWLVKDSVGCVVTQEDCRLGSNQPASQFVVVTGERFHVWAENVLTSMTLSLATHPAGSCWFRGKQVLELPIGTRNRSGSRPQLSYLFHLWFLSHWLNVTPPDGRCSIWTLWNVLYYTEQQPFVTARMPIAFHHHCRLPQGVWHRLLSNQSAIQWKGTFIQFFLTKYKSHFCFCF